MKYTVETTYPYRFYHYNTLKEAKQKCADLRKQGIKAQIICITKNGNDYILKED
jgi:F0F1-type ATP synthase gamma subunit